MWKKVLVFVFIIFTTTRADVLTPKDVPAIKNVCEVTISPDGRSIAYLVTVPRTAVDKPGRAFHELYVASVETGESRPYITGKSCPSSIAWSPDGSMISFREKRGDNTVTQVWGIPLDGGEARQLLDSETSVLLYRWHPDGQQIGYVAVTPKTDREKALAKKGYNFIYYEENLKDRNLYVVDVREGEGVAKRLTKDVSVWDFQFNHAGSAIAAAISEKNLVDHSYMFKKIYLIDLPNGRRTQLTTNEGKLGHFVFSPDDAKLVYNAALERKDHANSQAFVIDVAGGEAVNVTPKKFRGHIVWVSWQDDATVLYKANEGVWTTLNTVSARGGKRRVIYNAKETGVVIEKLSHTSNAEQFAFYGSSPTVPGELFYWQPGKDVQQLTTQNPWLKERQLGEQKVVTYKSRDGRAIEGLLIYPVDYTAGTRYPLIVNVHGGPESNFTNGWTRTTRYSIAGQVLAGRGYAVFYPNYGASTGYGLDHAYVGYKDAAGREFDDIADGIDFLVDSGIADVDRVGLGGGSYGGFASAWFATFYTEKVKAVCMFVGISDLISKRGTTDIPYEELYVHSGEKLEGMWQKSLEHSPIYYAHQSKTATFIAGGAADTRVHPSQSLEFYRRLKMNDHPAVRLVQYPGEGHGNSKQQGRIDYLYRHLQWYDWYVKEARPLDGPMPPFDLSEYYGLDLEE